MSIRFTKTEYRGLAAADSAFPPASLPEIILAGRSNVGKSSLINALAGARKLARVSRSPGKTRQVLFFNVDDQLILVDLPGYGYAAASKSETDAFARLTDRFLNSGRPVALILLLMDLRHSPSAQDVQMMDWCLASGYPLQVVWTKADKLSRSQAKVQMAKLAADLPEAAIQRPPIAISAAADQGLDQLRAVIAHALSDFVG